MATKKIDFSDLPEKTRVAHRSWVGEDGEPTAWLENINGNVCKVTTSGNEGVFVPGPDEQDQADWKSLDGAKPLPFGLTEKEIEHCNRLGISVRDYAEKKAMKAEGGRSRGRSRVRDTEPSTEKPAATEE